jgi:hypothetical protein
MNQPHLSFHPTRVVLALGLIAAGLGLLGALLDAPASAEPPDPTPGATSPVREQNLDGNGLIRVHEQGIADVTVTNTPLDVQGSVDVDNFPTSFEVSNLPAVQDVNVTGGALSNVTLAPVTKAISEIFFPLPAGVAETRTFAPINVTSIFIHDALDELSLTLLTPVAPTEIFVYSDSEDAEESVQLTFVHPIPVDGVGLSCLNESDDCQVIVDLLGF